MKTYHTILASFVILAIGIGSLFGQDAQPPDDPAAQATVANENVVYVGYVVLNPDTKDWQFAHDDEVHAKLDAIAQHLGLVIGEDTRPNLNTIDEQELFGIMSVAKVYGARSKAALIWSHIHNEGNTITTKSDLLAIAGIGDKTADALWPLVKVDHE
ncbi:MAG: hypothetical protein AAGI37_06945 [Planctomycetota bacterium]